MNLRLSLRHLQTGARKISPEIAIGIGILGFIMTAVEAVKVTPKALMLLEEEKRERRKAGEDDNLTVVDKVKIAGPCYVRPVVTGVISTACIVFADAKHLRRNAALASVCGATKGMLDEYRSKVQETIGVTKENQIHREVVQNRAQVMEPASIVQTGAGHTLMKFGFSGQGFESDIPFVSKCEAIITKRLFGPWGDELKINEIEDIMRLPESEAGDMAAIYASDFVNDDQFEFEKTSVIAADGRPCLVLDIPKWKWIK